MALAAIGILGMGAAVASKAANAQCEKQQMADKLSQVMDKTKTLKGQYDTVLANLEKLDTDMSGQITTLGKDIGALRAGIEVHKQNYRVVQRKIQIDGIVIVMIIVLLLFLKRIRFMKNVKRWFTSP
jgi:hypothetical protein